MSFDSTRRRLTILGSTGSIGRQALDVVRRYPDRFELVGLSAGSDARTLAAQATAFGPEYVALESTETGPLEGIEARILSGSGAAARLAAEPSDIVLNGIVGFAGLAATVAALQTGNRVALANKESLVAGGEWVMELATNNRIIPVDSEHSAIFQCLEGRKKEEVRGILLTASGGPFFGLEKARLLEAGPGDALKHPTWRMGPKITIDSATMMNKGLEVLEAHHLFGVPFDDVRVDVGAEPVSFDGVRWSFEEPRNDVFRCLPLAVEAGRAGGAYPVALNAANEVAVGAFLDRRIKFLQIADVVEEVMEAVPQESSAMESMEAITAADRWGRQKAQRAVQGAR